MGRKLITLRRTALNPGRATGSISTPLMIFHRSRLLCLFVVALLSLAEATATPERVFTVRGVIRSPYADGTVVISHEPIPQFMPAMTMRFNTTAADAAELRAGDTVEFEFHVGETSRATAFRKMSRAPAFATAVTGAAHVSAPRLRPGDRVPAFELVDQSGRPLTAADLSGEYTILTFIFTRCAVPEFCPLLARKFLDLQNAIAREEPAHPARTRLLSISLDPEHDRPEVLRQYGETLKANFHHWRFATGTTEAVDQLRRRFTVRAETNAGTIDHTLATALIDPAGRLVQIWRGNAWKPGEIIGHLRARQDAPR